MPWVKRELRETKREEREREREKRKRRNVEFGPWKKRNYC